MKKSNLFDKAVQRSNMGNMRTNIETQSPKGTIILEGAEMDYATAPVIRKSLAAFAKNGIYGYGSVLYCCNDPKYHCESESGCPDGKTGQRAGGKQNSRYVKPDTAPFSV